MKHIMSWRRWPLTENSDQQPGPHNPRNSTVISGRYMEGFRVGPVSFSVIFALNRDEFRGFSRGNVTYELGDGVPFCKMTHGTGTRSCVASSFVIESI